MGDGDSPSIEVGSHLTSDRDNYPSPVSLGDRSEMRLKNGENDSMGIN